MKIVTLGTVSSGSEFDRLCKSAKGQRAIEMMEFTTSVAGIETKGFATERKRWRKTDLDEAVKIYVADSTPVGGETTIWAAIDVGADGKTVTLLKIVDSYGGGNHESDALLTDAVDRKQRGRVS